MNSLTRMPQGLNPASRHGNALAFARNQAFTAGAISDAVPALIGLPVLIGLL